MEYFSFRRLGSYFDGAQHERRAGFAGNYELQEPPPNPFPQSLGGLLSSHKGMKLGDVVGEADRCILDRIIASIPLQWRGARQGGVVSGQ